MVYYIAIISNNEIQTLKLAGGSNNDPEGLREDGSTIVHIDFPISDKIEFIDTHYWDGEFKERDPKPNRFAKWSISEWTWNPEDLMNELRTHRNAKLSITDWTRMDDNGLDEDDREIWSIYRQELRDITEQYSSLDDVVWPESP
jgi:hypothetical protein